MDNSERYRVNYVAQGPETVKTDILDPIDYAYASTRSIDITIRQPEFTSVCPMTGLPDYGSIIVTYRPDTKIIELKSLKYYFLQFRNVGIFYEHIVNRILDDLVEALSPMSMTVTGEFTSRGGISSVATASYTKD